MLVLVGEVEAVEEERAGAYHYRHLPLWMEPLSLQLQRPSRSGGMCLVDQEEEDDILISMGPRFQSAGLGLEGTLTSVLGAR